MNKNFGVYLKSYRRKKNLTQIEFANSLNINDKYLSQIENGKLIASYKVVNGFLKYTGMTIEELQLEVGNMNGLNPSN